MCTSFKPTILAGVGASASEEWGGGGRNCNEKEVSASGIGGGVESKLLS
jgi:hypothetical protein